MKIKSALMITLCAVLLCSALASAQGVGRQAGSVVDEEGNPLEGVSVTIKDSDESTVSDAEGKWRFLRLNTPRTYIFVFKKEGYITNNTSKEVIDGPANRTFEVVLQKIVITPAQEANQLFNEGNALMRQRDFEGALEKYKRAVELQPEDVQYQFSTGVCLFFMKDYEGALEYFEPNAPTLSGNAQAMALIGDSYFNTEQYEKAVEIYGMLRDRQVVDQSSLANLANALHQLERYEEEIAVLEDVINLDPGNWNLFARKAALHEMAGDIDKAIESLMMVHEIQGDKISAKIKTALVTLLENRGNELLESGKPAEAIPYFEKIILVSPGSDEATNAQTIIDTAKEMGSN